MPPRLTTFLTNTAPGIAKFSLCNPLTNASGHPQQVYNAPALGQLSRRLSVSFHFPHLSSLQRLLQPSRPLSSYCCLRHTMTPSTDLPKPGSVSKDSKDAQVSIQDEKELRQWFIGSIDQGTTSTRFLIFDGTGSPIASHQMEFRQMYPHSGSVKTYQRRCHSVSVDRYVDG